VNNIQEPYESGLKVGCDDLEVIRGGNFNSK
jgi:hypothetical protein